MLRQDINIYDMIYTIYDAIGYDINDIRYYIRYPLIRVTPSVDAVSSI